MINQATLIGRVGKIDFKSTNSGDKIANISLVTSKRYPKDSGKEEKITWHTVVLFSRLAEVAESYVKVGDLLYVQGEMDHKKYIGKDGQNRINFRVIGYEIKMFPRTKEHVAAPASQPKAEAAQGTPFEDDDIPW